MKLRQRFDSFSGLFNRAYKYITLGAFAAALLPQASHAVNIQQFSRSNSLVFEMLEDSRMENSHVYADYDAIFTLGGSWVDNPFVLKSSNNSSVTGEPLPSMKTLHFGAGVYFKPWLMFGLTTGYSSFDWKTLNNSGATVGSGSKSGINDIELKSKIRFLRKPQWALSVMPFVTIPTGSGTFDPISSDSLGENNFLGDDNVGFGAKLLAEYLFSFMQVVANVGYKHNSGAKYSSDLDYSSMLYTGIGAYVPITDKIGANIEYVRQWQMPFSSDQNPNETYLGLSAGITRRLHAFAGVGLGNLFQDSDGNDWRASAGIKFIPLLWSEEQKPLTEVTQDQIQAAVAENTSPPEVLAPQSADNTASGNTPRYIFNNKSNTAVVRFANNSAKLEENSALATVVQMLVDNKEHIKKITLVGHASLVGDEDFNLFISKKRALSVKAFLVSKGMDSKLIETAAKGEAEPLINNESTEANNSNRRVEFKITTQSE
jgi:outer membrane protein OmpA-like peptidoglycan-associated protein